ncbi:MAG: hypothetical protein AAGC44_08535 [Planctomycetota bacterium]
MTLESSYVPTAEPRGDKLESSRALLWIAIAIYLVSGGFTLVIALAGMADKSWNWSIVDWPNFLMDKLNTFIGFTAMIAWLLGFTRIRSLREQNLASQHGLGHLAVCSIYLIGIIGTLLVCFDVNLEKWILLGELEWYPPGTWIRYFWGACLGMLLMAILAEVTAWVDR